MTPINYNSFRSIKSSDKRVRFLVMHYTAANFSNSVSALTGPSVSAHYLVPDPKDPTYLSSGFKDLQIFNLVNENERAWHAGLSYWAGVTGLNYSSIGIEIVNEATDVNGVFNFPPFNEQQISAVKELALNILQRYPEIKAKYVVGHSDIAPGRKSDPGAAFPWYQLYLSGVGAWYDENTKDKYVKTYSETPLPREEAIRLLKQYGYDISAANSDAGYQKLVRAFQLHFRQENYNGVMDIETMAILAALVEKYPN
ncbi:MULTISPECIES: N-acetylmuramoyl-L-alanine amidase [Yersinia]|uniref:N-acetylmuramoyl-L-alanine amidase n=1 Tax=Yersinia intermedia TaxID=631 RepID=A0A0H5LY14_YERIN|nr:MULTISPECIES: N-acetylmuramoyl-L-alanine amidase [Yersinia]MCB5308030.1 N-acetylmuramoyl-L-alanine amidase [Yersinia massiliensis]CRY55792.1 N-acetylmuramoyl-L-alanine amidase [Yersinia intermedia]